MLNMVCVNSSYSVLHRTQHRKGVMCVVSLNFRLFYFVQCHVWRSSYQCRNATINHMCEYTYWFQHIFLQYRRYWMSKVNPSPRLLCIMWSCIKILKITFWHIIWQTRQRSNENSAPWVVEIFLKAEIFSSIWGLMSDRVNSSFIVRPWLWNIIIFWASMILFSHKLSYICRPSKNCLPVIPRDLQEDLSFSW